MCRYSIYLNPICGHASHFSMESCLDMFPLMRTGKNVCDNTTFAHHVVYEEEVTNCSFCSTQSCAAKNADPGVAAGQVESSAVAPVMCLVSGCSERHYPGSPVADDDREEERKDAETFWIDSPIQQKPASFIDKLPSYPKLDVSPEIQPSEAEVVVEAEKRPLPKPAKRRPTLPPINTNLPYSPKAEIVQVFPEVAPTPEVANPFDEAMSEGASVASSPSIVFRIPDYEKPMTDRRDPAHGAISPRQKDLLDFSPVSKPTNRQTDWFLPPPSDEEAMEAEKSPIEYRSTETGFLAEWFKKHQKTLDQLNQRADQLNEVSVFSDDSDDESDENPIIEPSPVVKRNIFDNILHRNSDDAPKLQFPTHMAGSFEPECMLDTPIDQEWIRLPESSPQEQETDSTSTGFVPKFVGSSFLSQKAIKSLTSPSDEVDADDELANWAKNLREDKTQTEWDWLEPMSPGVPEPEEAPEKSPSIFGRSETWPSQSMFGRQSYYGVSKSPFGESIFAPNSQIFAPQRGENPFASFGKPKDPFSDSQPDKFQFSFGKSSPLKFGESASEISSESWNSGSQETFTEPKKPWVPHRFRYIPKFRAVEGIRLARSPIRHRRVEELRTSESWSKRSGLANLLGEDGLRHYDAYW